MRTLVTALFALFLTSPAFGQFPVATPAAAKPAPKVEIVDDKVSIQAEGVQLSRLLRLLDLATGMTSTVSAGADRTLSVRFSNLDFDAAIRKIFEGQNLDYIIFGKNIQVKGVSSSTPGTAGSSAYTAPTPTPDAFRVNDAGIISAGAVPSAVGTNPPAAAPTTVQTPIVGAGNAANAPRPVTAPAAAPPPAPGAVPMFSQPTVIAPTTSGGAPSPAPNPLGTGAVPVFK